ncbi:MAG: hypothetical protein A2W00_01860 [Candidatus Eisenbacteria bacterium RBG_16_71_46]|nr:MAG: hypothetical protein A2W00_01860 [Candidatus Eisenbacteria bacterium RBG_16_71_46]OGF24702.1 MAG: hypothetical protein A2V63_11035 [Candidatus Eisenbacteria bacterium RBG_19FT_COMBO_70_11]
MSNASAILSPSERLRTYASFVRFEHTLFSLPLLVAGSFSAPGPPLPTSRWLLIAVAAVGARTAALALNRLIDRELDALNPRTRVRELPAGRMKLAEATALLAGSTAAYLVACALLGAWYLRVSWIPLAVFVGYPYLKRVTPLCHFGVGAALALAPLAGYAAAHPDLGAPGAALALAGFALCWVAGFDIIYATLDESFDRAHGLHSMVVWLGRRRALAVSAGLHVLGFPLLLAAAVLAGGARIHAIGNWPSWVPLGIGLSAGAVATLLFFEVKWAANVDLAFFKANVAVGFAALALMLFARVPGGF